MVVEASLESVVEESKTAIATAQNQVLAQKQFKPVFKDFISCFSSMGFWQPSKREDLAACVEGDSFNDITVRETLQMMSLSGEVDMEVVYMTLLAWYTLEESFADEEDQWQLIGDKIETWLESVGVESPNSVKDQFTLTLRN